MADGKGNTTQYAYDARKRLTTTTYPDQTTKTNAYDGPGNLISVTDQAGQQVQYSYDAANQLINVVQSTQANNSGSQATTIYGYDALGNPITLEDANTHATLQSFDPLSELTSKTLPDKTLTESRTYDSNGNLATVTHFNGVTTTYAYDQLNRLLSRSTPGETPVSFTYSYTGKRQTMSDASGTTSYTYDSMDRLTQKATPEGTLTYSYDAAGNLASMQSADGAVNVGYTWNSLNLLGQVADGRLGTTSYQYDPANNLLTMTYPNQVVSNYTYDELNRVSIMASGNSGYAYQRGPTGNLTGAVELSNRTVNWGYNGVYQLTGETITGDPSKNNGSVGYGLDPVGNRLTESSSLPDIPSGSWGYNPDDEVSSESYDQNGNVIASGGKTFSYDSENHLMSMGGTVALLYDGDGNRVAKSVNGVVTRYLVDDLNPTGYPQVVEELNGSNVATRTYTYGLQRISEYQPISNVWTASFYGYDGMGSVRQLTNAVGAVTDTYEYDAFGNSFTVSGTTPNNYLYRGEQYDPDLGLYYLRARYYNPITGTFMSRDPEKLCRCSLDNPSSLHAYNYASTDPVDRVDPSGRASVGEDEETSLIGLLVVSAKAAVPYAVAAGVGAGVGATAWTMTVSALCLLNYDLEGIEAVTANLGPGEKFWFWMSGCQVKSSRVPGKDIGPYPAPFYPDEQWATEPGNPWQCEANAEGRVTFCKRPCPGGGEEWFTWDPGTKYGEPPHWDWHRCDGTTCKIYTDGTSTCPPEAE